MKNQFEKNILNIYGDQGKTWLESLPTLLQKMAEKYALSNLKPFDNLSYNYVSSGFIGVQPIVLKLGLDIDALQREAGALKAFNEYGCIKLISEEKGVLLLEQATPGDSLKSYFPEADMEAIAIAAKLMQKLHKSLARQDFPHIRDWLKALDKDIDIPFTILKKARNLRDELLGSSTEEALLHGDLHHDNIIQNGEDWVAIDPKGVIGDPALEIAAFMMNPITELLDSVDAESIIENRINAFSRLLDIDPNRIRDWCFVKRVLCSIWAIEDGLDPKHFID